MIIRAQSPSLDKLTTQSSFRQKLSNRSDVFRKVSKFSVKFNSIQFEMPCPKPSYPPMCGPIPVGYLPICRPMKCGPPSYCSPTDPPCPTPLCLPCPPVCIKPPICGSVGPIGPCWYDTPCVTSQGCCEFLECLDTKHRY